MTYLPGTPHVYGKDTSDLTLRVLALEKALGSLGVSGGGAATFAGGSVNSGYVPQSNYVGVQVRPRGLSALIYTSPNESALIAADGAGNNVPLIIEAEGFFFEVLGTEILIIDSTGNIIPFVNNAQTLGLANLAWKGAYLNVLFLPKLAAAPGSNASYGQVFSETDGNLYYITPTGTVYRLTPPSSLSGGTTNKIPYWTSASTLGSSPLTEVATSGLITLGLPNNDGLFWLDTTGAYTMGIVGYSLNHLALYTKTGKMVQMTDGSTVFANFGNQDAVEITSYSTVNTSLAINGVGLAGNWVSLSDRRFKKNIRPIDKALDKTLKLTGVYYELKDRNEPRQIGLIAQDTHQVVPEIVHGNPDGENMMGIHYGPLAALLVEAIKELKQQNDRLEERLSALEGLPRPLSKKKSRFSWLPWRK